MPIPHRFPRAVRRAPRRRCSSRLHVFGGRLEPVRQRRPSLAVASATPAATAAPTAAPTPDPGARLPGDPDRRRGDGRHASRPSPGRSSRSRPAATETLFAIGAGDRVVAKVEDVADFPPEADDVPVVATFQGVDTEKIVGLGADLVIAGGNFGTAPDAIAKLRSLGIPVLVVYVKRGEYGVLMFTGDRVFAVPAFPLEEVKDPTGAGDCFAGGFMGYLARTGKLSEEALRRAVVYGSVMASFAVEAFSLDRLRELEYQDIEDRFGAFKQMTVFEELE